MKDHLKWATENDTKHWLSYIYMAVAIALFVTSWLIWDNATEVSVDPLGLALRVGTAFIIGLVGAWCLVKSFRGN